MKITYIEQDWETFTTYLTILTNDNDDYIGSYDITQYEDEIILGNIYVNKIHRGRGYSILLIEDAISKRYYNRNTNTNLYLLVNKENKIAINLYKKYGFEYDSDYDDEGIYYWMKYILK